MQKRSKRGPVQNDTMVGVHYSQTFEEFAAAATLANPSSL